MSRANAISADEVLLRIQHFDSDEDIAEEDDFGELYGDEDQVASNFSDEDSGTTHDDEETIYPRHKRFYTRKRKVHSLE